ncbi:MAG: DOPA 4,5-dioxygenase family protein [Sphingomicrobium sp.]
MRYRARMVEAAIRDFHAHIYYDPEQIDFARELAAAVQARYPVAVGHFHLRPVGPHPRGSCQMTVPAELFGDVARWLVLRREALTVFAHANTGHDLADHTQHVIWFGPSETLDLSIFS